MFAALVSTLCGATGASAETASVPPLSAGVPLLQLPWPAGQQHNQNGGNSYGCGDHTGKDYYAIDFNLPANSQVSAVAAGTAHLVTAANSGGYGNLVWVDHGSGVISLYAHLNSFAVNEGEQVAQGQLIGLSGSTGNSTGPHLHFVIRTGATAWYNGQSLPPEPMSGYTGFGNYGLHGPSCVNAVSPMYTSEPPSPPADGSFVQVSGSSAIYRIAGGAALYVSNWDAFGGPQPYSVISQQTFDALRPYPADGTFVTSTADGRVYEVVGGAPEYISAADASKVPGWGSRPVIGIDQWDITNIGNPAAHLRPYPADGTFICNVDDGRCYETAGGAPLYISAADASEVPGWTTNTITTTSGWEFTNYQHLRPYPADGTVIVNVDDGRVYVVAGGAPEYVSAADASQVPAYVSNPHIVLSGWEFGSYQHLREYPANGTLISNVDNGRVYVVAGGAPEWISAADAGNIPGWGSQPVTALSAYEFGAYEHLLAYPVAGTFLTTTSGKIYRVAGQAPFGISSWSVFGGTQPHITVDQWDIDNAGQSGVALRSAPIDGTLVEGLPSDSYWSFKAGYRTPSGASGTAIEVDDFGLSAYPMTSTSGDGGGSVACVVPRLTHMTLHRARIALRRTHCRLGTVHRPKHAHRHHTLRVSRQSAEPGTRHRVNFSVNVKLT